MVDKGAANRAATPFRALAGVWERQGRMVLTALLFLTALGLAFYALGMLGSRVS